MDKDFPQFAELPPELQSRVFSGERVRTARELTSGLRERALWEKVERDILLQPKTKEIEEYFSTSPATVKIIYESSNLKPEIVGNAVTYRRHYDGYDKRVIGYEISQDTGIQSFFTDEDYETEDVEKLSTSYKIWTGYSVSTVNYAVDIVYYDIRTMKWIIRNRLIKFGVPVELIPIQTRKYIIQYVDNFIENPNNSASLKFLFLFFSAQLLNIPTDEEKNFIYEDGRSEEFNINDENDDGTIFVTQSINRLYPLVLEKI